MDNSLFRKISVRCRIICAFGIIAGIMGGSILILTIFQSQTLGSLNHVIEVDSRSDHLMLKASAKVVQSRLDLLRFIMDYLPSTANALEDAREARTLLAKVDEHAHMNGTDLNALLEDLDAFIRQIGHVQKAQKTKGHPESVRMAFLASKTGHDIGQRIEKIVSQNEIHMQFAVSQAQSHARKRLIIYSTGYVIIVCFALVLSVFLAKSITRPVRSLGRAAMAFQRGEFDTLAPVSGRDEITSLAKTFNTMAVRLRASFSELREYRDSLEEKVALRTREISRANDQLKRENMVRRQVEKALQRAKNEAEAANRAKGQFLANMSHEIRTPMNGIMGMTRFLLDSDLDKVQKDYAENIKTSSEALMGILNDILDLSKIEAGKLEFETRDFDLRAVLEDIIGFLGVKAHEKKLEIGCLLDPDIFHMVRGDPGRLRQIILNLAVNAIKFTWEGEVAVRVTRSDETEERITYLFRITDTGIGIPDHKRDRLFKSFSQVDTSTTRQFGGTGLGLVISKRLTQMMGGEIGVRPQAGKGSEFWFTVSFEKQPGLTTSPAAPFHAEIQGVRILAVEGNALNREILDRYMESWGCRVAVVENGAAGCDLLKDSVAEKDPFALVIVERVEADTVMTEIKRHSVFQNIPLVLLDVSGMGDSQALEMGFNGFVKKPVRPSELYAAVLALLAPEVQPVPESGLNDTAVPDGSEGIPGDTGGLRILLVEDNPVNQQVALIMLRKIGYGADLVSNGREAVEAVQRRDYDLILMDIQMPEVDGFQATQMIRRLGGACAAVPIIAMTANAMKGDREKCLAAGMTDYIAKPVRPELLYGAITAATTASNKNIFRKNGSFRG